MKLTYTIQPNDNFFNVKELLKLKFQISDRLLVKLKKNKKIWLNSTPTFVDSRLKPFDIVEILIDFEEKSENIIPTQMDLNIIYEDEYYIVINKPSGIAIHPSILHYTDSLANGVKFYFEQKNIKKKIRPINRLDKDTSGIVVFAKNEYAQENFKPICKEYIAIINGIFSGNGIIDLPIGRKNGSIIERCIDYENGDSAITEYEVIKNISEYNLSIVKCTLMTGRTHQIRVHLANKLSPILWDTLYGSTSNLINRQALHSYHLRLIHPINKKVVDIYAPIPEDISNIIK